MDNWNDSDYFGEDELKGFEREWPPHGTERHRWLSTIKRLQDKLVELGEDKEAMAEEAYQQYLEARNAREQLRALLHVQEMAT